VWGPVARHTLGVRFPPRVDPPPAFLNALLRACSEVRTEDLEIEDGWALSMLWRHDEVTPATVTAVARPATAHEVADVLRVCSAYRVPVTPAGGRTGTNGGALPVLGGILLDTTRLAGVRSVDVVSRTVDVLAGTTWDALEDELAGLGLTCACVPLPVPGSTVGGRLAIEDVQHLVVGLEIALTDGSLIRTGEGAGPDMTRDFIGSEGTLGVLTAARLRVCPAPTDSWRAAWSFPSFDAGLRAARQIVQRGVAPTVLRVFDSIESAARFGSSGHTLIAVADGDPATVAAARTIADEACTSAQRLAPEVVAHGVLDEGRVAKRAAVARGQILDVIDIATPWTEVAPLYTRVLAALRDVDGMASASIHQALATPQGVCLCVTFTGAPPPEEREEFYVRAWDIVEHLALSSGALLSHHRGIGLNRSRFVHEALGARAAALAQARKDALDPAGVLNPGKLGLTSSIGEVHWP
jgi:alkyldihydroxyacetonephosphate synthase